ncbi:hypothetical protein VM98_35210, partial [Streptomyces rubellomurinus subsp. indigoferus]
GRGGWNRETYGARREGAATLEERTTRGREGAQEAELLRCGLDGVAAAEPVAGEDAELAAEGWADRGGGGRRGPGPACSRVRRAAAGREWHTSRLNARPDSAGSDPG